MSEEMRDAIQRAAIMAAAKQMKEAEARIAELERLIAQAGQRTNQAESVARDLGRVRCSGCLAQAARAENAERKVDELEEYWVERTAADEACEEHRREHEAMVEKARAEAAHARRSIKQACLFAVEGTRLADNSTTIGPLWFAGWQKAIEVAADAVAQVEVD